MKIALIGQGGHSKVIQEMITEKVGWEVIGCFDDKYEREFSAEGCYFGPIAAALKLAEYFNDVKFIIAIGNNQTRKAVADKLDLPEEAYASIIHRSATISKSAKIGSGTVIMPGAVVNVDTRIGKHCIINTNAVIEHDNQLGSFAHISPNATITGTVQIGDGVHIGVGASIIPNIIIGEWVIIGAGAVVIEDIPSYSSAVGVPAKIIKKLIPGGV